MQAESKEQLRLKIREIEAKLYHYGKSARAEIQRLTKENNELKRDAKSYGNRFRTSCLKEGAQ